MQVPCKASLGRVKEEGQRGPPVVCCNTRQSPSYRGSLLRKACACSPVQGQGDTVGGNGQEDQHLEDAHVGQQQQLLPEPESLWDDPQGSFAVRCLQLLVKLSTAKWKVRPCLRMPSCTLNFTQAMVASKNRGKSFGGLPLKCMETLER